MQTLKLRKRIDPFIPSIGIALSVFGLVMILSASQISSAENYGNPYHFFTRQLVAWVIGLMGFFYFLRTPLEKLYQNRSWYLGIAIFLLMLVFVPGIGAPIAGVHRWVHIAGWQFQPSDFTKLFLLIYLAAWLSSKNEIAGHFSRGFLPFCLVLLVVLGLVEVGHDLSTLVIIAVMSLSIFLVAQTKWWQTLLLVVGGLAVVFFLIFSTGYRQDRLGVFLGGSNKITNNSSSSTSKLDDYHAQQALIAIGNGGLWGVGFGQGISKYAYLPESHTDSIFAVIAEELGFVRASLVILAFMFLGWRIYLIALKANSQFVKLLAVGGGVLIIFQALVNIGGMLGLIPLSGVTLPLLSYGGTSLMINMFILGLLTNASREVI